MSALPLCALHLSPLQSQPQFLCAPFGCTLCPFWEADFLLRPFWQMLTIQNLRKSLVRSWKLVCHLVRDTNSGAEFSPFPSALPPASSRGWASLQPASSSLELLSPFVLQAASSVFRPVNFLSLSCCPTV